MKRWFILLLFGSCWAFACDDTKTNTGLCRDVYTALCHRSHECDMLDAVNACVVYYHEDCQQRRLHAGVADPLQAEVDACVAAIETMDCSNLEPTSLSECAFLIEPADAGVDGGDDADTSGDADTDSADGDVAETDAPDADVEG